MYDKHLADYEKSSIKITTSLAFLNSGQNIIFSGALTMAMWLAADGVLSEIILYHHLLTSTFYFDASKLPSKVHSTQYPVNSHRRRIDLPQIDSLVPK